MSSGGRPLTAVREEFDPATLKDDDFLIVPGGAAGSGSSASVEAPDVTAPEPSHTVAGYRVQIAAVFDNDRANVIREAAQQKLKQLVYVISDVETLLYKVQVGNLRNAESARSLRIDARAAGYPDAFVIRTEVEDASPPVKRTTAMGFRVQIFSASNRPSADIARQRAQDLFVRDDIYVEFEPPFYKVRIGDFTSREAAQRFVDTARQHGYETPFLVETQIRVSPR